MTDPHQQVTLSYVDPYYPLIYQNEFTKKFKGSSVTFFDFLQVYLPDISYEYVQYNEYQVANRSLTDPGGVLGAIADGNVLTELTGAGALASYLQIFSLTPAIGTYTFSFYEGTLDSETWSPLSSFIPFSPLIFTLSIVSTVIIELLQLRRRARSPLATIFTGISSALFAVGITFIFFAYGAGFQGNMIAVTPVEEMQVPYDHILNAFERGARLWYFHLEFLADFSSLAHIPTVVERDLPKLIGLMCERPGVVTASLYTEEYLDMQMYDAPRGCRIRKVNMVEPTQPSPTYYNFLFAHYYFLLPKRIPKRLRNAINFISTSVFQADQRKGRILYSSVDARSFDDITPVQPPLADYSPLSLYSLGIIIVIFASLLFLAVIVFVLEIVVHRLKSRRRVALYSPDIDNLSILSHCKSILRRKA